MLDYCVWPLIESHIWSGPAETLPTNADELTKAIYRAVDVMNTDGTELNQKMKNAFYGTKDDESGEFRLYYNSLTI